MESNFPVAIQGTQHQHASVLLRTNETVKHWFAKVDHWRTFHHRRQRLTGLPTERIQNAYTQTQPKPRTKCCTGSSTHALGPTKLVPFFQEFPSLEKKKHLQNLDPIVLDRAFFVKSVWHVVIATYWQPHTSTRPTPVLCTNRTVVRGHVVFFILDLWGLHLL